MENVQNFSIKVQWSTSSDIYYSNFMPICPVTKKCEFIVPVTKNMHLFPPTFCAPLAQGVIILKHENMRFEVGCSDLLRFAGVIREKPFLSKYILRMTAYKSCWSPVLVRLAPPGEYY